MKSIHSLCVVSVALALTGLMPSPTVVAPQNPVAVPNTFSSGTPALASEVNENFEALASGINANGMRVDQNAQAIEDLSAGYELVRSVAKSGAEFTTVADALASITDAAADRPYRVNVAPGVYDEAVPLIVPSFVRLAGAGISTTTIRRAAAGASQSSDAAVITIEDNAQLCDLSVLNPGGSSAFSIGVLGFGLGNATRIDRIESTVNGAGGNGHFAILLQSSDVVVRDSIGRASGATISNAGLASTNFSGQVSNLRVEGCQFESDAGNTGFGMQIASTSAVIQDCNLFGSKHALLAQVAGASEVQGSTLRSVQEVMSQTGAATLQLATTKLSGLNSLGFASSFQYVNCYKENYSPVVNGFGSTTQN